MAFTSSDPQVPQINPIVDQALGDVYNLPSTPYGQSNIIEMDYSAYVPSAGGSEYSYNPAPSQAYQDAISGAYAYNPTNPGSSQGATGSSSFLQQLANSYKQQQNSLSDQLNRQMAYNNAIQRRAVANQASAMRQNSRIANREQSMKRDAIRRELERGNKIDRQFAGSRARGGTTFRSGY